MDGGGLVSPVHTVPDDVFGITNSRVFDDWLGALTAYLSEREAEHTKRLHGKPVRTRDDRGLDVRSVEAGRVYALEALLPELALAGFDPRVFDSDARESAAAAVRESLTDEMAQQGGTDV